MLLGGSMAAGLLFIVGWVLGVDVALTPYLVGALLAHEA